MKESTMTAKARNNGGTYTGFVQCFESGRVIWNEECNTVRLNKDDALEDANALLDYHEGISLNANNVQWNYAPVYQIDAGK
jgi:hypothetical protein